MCEGYHDQVIVPLLWVCARREEVDSLGEVQKKGVLIGTADPNVKEGAKMTALDSSSTHSYGQAGSTNMKALIRSCSNINGLSHTIKIPWMYTSAANMLANGQIKSEILGLFRPCKLKSK